MNGIVEINDGNFSAEVVSYQGKVLVDFWAPWCGPCRMQGPILEKVVNSGEISAKIGKSNVDENPGIASQYGITSIPTLILFENGKEIERMIGVQNEASLLGKLK